MLSFCIADDTQHNITQQSNKNIMTLTLTLTLDSEILVMLSVIYAEFLYVLLMTLSITLLSKVIKT
jgi:hypothetical protein